MATELEQCHSEIKELEAQISELHGDPGAPSRIQELAATNAETNKNYHPLALKNRKILKGHFGKIYALHWGSDSRKLVSASQDGKLIIWNAHSTNKLNSIPLRSSWVMTCAYSPDESLVACGGLDNLCSVYSSDTDNSKTKYELAQHEGYLSCCRFVGNDKIVTSSGDSTCILWDVSNQMPIKLFNGHNGDVVSLDVLNENHNTFISGSCDSSVKLWDIRTNCERTSVMTFPGHESDVNSVKFFPDGNAFASGSDDCSCRLFDIRACRQIGKYIDDKCITVVTAVAFSESGRYMFAGNDDFFTYVWDTQKCEQVGLLEGHTGRVSCLATAPNGKSVCTGSWDLSLKIFA